MATKKGVWNLQQVRDKQLQSLWDYWDLYVNGNGELWTWGLNNYGNLGHNQAHQAKISSPVQVGSATNWVRLMGSGGGTSAGAINTDAELWVWGRNEYGQLGQNDRTSLSSPTQIPGSWTYGSISDNSMAAVNTSGELWSWGQNEYGQIGQSNTTKYSSPVQVPGSTWVSVIGGSGAFKGVKTDGTLWCWGYNHRGQLGVNNTTNYSSPKQVPGTTWTLSNNTSRGEQAVRFMKTDGTMWSWGYNGGLGLNDTVKRSSPTQIPGTDWSTIGGATYNGIATKTDGTLWMWGTNNKGILGQNEGPGAASRSSPIQVGSGTDWLVGHTPDNKYVIATKTDGTLWSWGYNYFGQLGQNNETEYSSPIQIPGSWSGKINAIGGGDHSTFVIKPIVS